MNEPPSTECIRWVHGLVWQDSSVLVWFSRHRPLQTLPELGRTNYFRVTAGTSLTSVAAQTPISRTRHYPVLGIGPAFPPLSDVSTRFNSGGFGLAVLAVT